MENSPSAAAKKTSIIYIAIALIAVVLVLAVFNFQNIGSYQQMAQDVQNDLFSEQKEQAAQKRQSSVEAVLVTYRNINNILELKVNVRGVEGELGQYRADVLKFVCSHDALKSALENGKTVKLELVATRRKQDKYFELAIEQSLCSGVV